MGDPSPRPHHGSHGPIGLPIQQVRAGTASPRMTSETGPIVVCLPIDAAGRITLFGPERRARAQHHLVHAQHPVVEQVRLHHAAPVDGRAVVEADQVGLGQPVAVHPDAAADPGAEGAQPDVERDGALRGPGEPRRGDHLGEGVGELVAPDERRPQRVLAGAVPADQQPLGQRRSRPPRPARRAAAPDPASTHGQPGGLLQQQGRGRGPRRPRGAPAAASAPRAAARRRHGRPGAGSAGRRSGSRRRRPSCGAAGWAGCRPTTSAPSPRRAPGRRTAPRRATPWAPCDRAPPSPSCRRRRACRSSPVPRASSRRPARSSPRGCRRRGRSGRRSW